MKGLTVSVNFGDLLAVTLPRNAYHFDEIVVVTDANDEETHKVVREIPNARLHVTDAFYRNGARFNRGLAIEEGWDVLGRDGWLMMWDADILFPQPLPVNTQQLDQERLYSPWRRILHDPSRWYPGLDWALLERQKDRIMAGYFQLFHAEASCLPDQWYTTHWQHAGECDNDFCNHWPEPLWERMQFDVLHLGPPETNWFGRVGKRMDGNDPTTSPDVVEEMAAARVRRRKFKVKDVRRFEGEQLP